MDITALAESFPLMRGGGAFLVAIGLGIVIGAPGNRRWRLTSNFRVFWAVDGMLKVAAGAAMIWLTYL